MPDYLSSVAAEELLELIQDSYFGGLCSWSETTSRLAALSALCGSSKEKLIAQRVLAMDDFSFEDRWNDEPKIEQDERRPGPGPDGPHQTQVSLSRPDWLDEDEPAILQLIPATSTGLADWEFHQVDADFFPSIPHGHWHGRNQPKLDAYTGWIYQGSQQTSREKRKKIVALWNDQKFRAFARAAIEYYLGEFPSYRGWRVKNPRRLPRRK